jgi:glycosyltransferase involved in cell wall biosynthesis
MEALALGRPVISTYVAGIPELVTPGQCGWLVPAGAIDPLVDALHAVLNADPKDLDVMGDEGRTRVRARHNAPYAARLLMDAFPT